MADPRGSARDARLPFPVDPIYLIFMQFLGKFWRPTCRVCPSIWEIVDPLLRKTEERKDTQNLADTLMSVVRFVAEGFVMVM